MSSTFIPLNAAVTLLAFGKRRTPSEELELRRSDQRKIVDLIDVCLAEAQESDSYASFPRRMPYWPLRALVERLDQHRAHWPPSAKKLRVLAIRLERKWRGYDDDYDRALGRIIEAAQGGRLDLLGQASRRAGAEVRVIPSANLLGDVTIDHQRSHLGSDVTARDRPRPFIILKAGPGLQPIHYNVVVSMEQFRETFRNALARARMTPSKDIEKKMTKWYLERVSEHVKRGQIPSRDADEKATRAMFAGVPKLRDIVRDLRHEHAPSEWTEKGRRRQKRK